MEGAGRVCGCCGGDAVSRSHTETDGPNQQQQSFRLNVVFKHEHAESRSAAVQLGSLQLWGCFGLGWRVHQHAGEVQAGGSVLDLSSPGPGRITRGCMHPCSR